MGSKGYAGIGLNLSSTYGWLGFGFATGDSLSSSPNSVSRPGTDYGGFGIMLVLPIRLTERNSFVVNF